MRTILFFACVILVYSCHQNASDESLIPLEKLKIGNQRFVSGRFSNTSGSDVYPAWG